MFQTMTSSHLLHLISSLWQPAYDLMPSRTSPTFTTGYLSGQESITRLHYWHSNQ